MSLTTTGNDKADHIRRQTTHIPTMEELLAPLEEEELWEMKNWELVDQLLCAELCSNLPPEVMSGKWRAMAFRAVEGAPAVLYRFRKDALADSEPVERSEWDEPCCCGCRACAYRNGQQELRRLGT
jgi:hypothetical protein